MAESGPAASEALPRAFYERKVTVVARCLLGQRLVRASTAGHLSGWIVEVEAYMHGMDPASHSYRGLTRRNATMFGPPGHAYVYTIHSRFCVNAVAEAEGRGAAVLIRAIEPLEGLVLMRAHRGRERLHELTTGPAKLCEALDIDLAWNGWDLTEGQGLWVGAGPPIPRRRIGVSPRIGISSGQDMPLRFFVRGNRFVSGPRSLSR